MSLNIFKKDRFYEILTHTIKIEKGLELYVHKEVETNEFFIFNFNDNTKRRIDLVKEYEKNNKNYLLLGQVLDYQDEPLWLYVFPEMKKN